MFLESLVAKLHVVLLALTPATHPVATTLCHLQDSRITESSGVAVSGDVLYTHDDSGDTARYFALDRHCRTLSTYAVLGEQAVDWEDVALGAGYLWFGDIGDNSSRRSTVAVVRVRERGTEATVFRFRYDDGAHDAETLLVQPLTGQLFVVTKSYLGLSSVYAAPLHPSASAVDVLTRVTGFTTHLTGTPGGPIGAPGRLAVTGGDINADATRLVVRTYTDAYEWTIPDGDVVKAFDGHPTVTPLPPTKQGEGIAYDTDGRSWITTSEGKGAPVGRVAR